MERTEILTINGLGGKKVKGGDLPGIQEKRNLDLNEEGKES